MTWDIPLNKNSDIPLYRQLSGGIIELITQGKLKPDSKLPPIRQMARVHNVNNTTVVTAYKYLEQKAAVYSVAGSGTYVAQAMSVDVPTAQVLPVITDDYINFADMATEAALFPVAAFKRAFDAVMDRDGAEAFGYHGSRGYGPLRESLCQIPEALAVKSTPEQVHVISGAEQGLNILANALLSPGDTVFAERPTSQRVVAALLTKRAKIIEMPMAKNGPDFNSLEALIKRHRPKLFYVKPNFQQPLSICYSAESKRRLLELVCACDAYIIEEDQFGDFYYDDERRTPLKVTDYGDRVIYMKSFSRILTPGIGMGYIICPAWMQELKPTADVSPPGYAQRAFDVFLRSGAFELHTSNMRRVYGRRFQRLASAARAYLTPYADFELYGGGLSLWITPRAPNNRDMNDYVDKFLQRKVVVSPGQLFATDLPGFRVSFAAVQEERIAEGIGIIASVLAVE